MGVGRGPVGDVEIDSLTILGTKVTSTPTELNLLAGVSGLVQADLTKLAAIVASAAEIDNLNGYTGNLADLNSLAGVGAVGQVVAKMITFTENTVNTTFTGSINVPAGAYLLDVIIHAVALWNDGTAASMIVGDATDPNGFYDAVDLKATDLAAGEQARIGQTGGLEGADFDGGESAGDQIRRGYLAASRVVTGVVTVTDKDGTTGVTHMVVVYVVPTNTAATASGT